MSLKRPGGEAAPIKENPASEAARRVFSGVATEAPVRAKTRKTTATFMLDPADYAAMKVVAEDMGLGVGAAIRVAIREFLKRKGAV